MGRVAVMVLVSGEKKVWDTLSGISGGKYIPPYEAQNGQMVGELAPIPLDQLVRIIKVWDRLRLKGSYKRLKKGNSQGRVKGEIVPPEANLGEVL